MTTRIREQGTKETYSTSEQEKISAIREVVTGHSYGKIDGVTLDVVTANMLITVYDALNEDNRKQFARFSIPKMVTIGWKLVK